MNALAKIEAAKAGSASPRISAREGWRCACRSRRRIAIFASSLEALTRGRGRSSAPPGPGKQPRELGSEAADRFHPPPSANAQLTIKAPPGRPGQARLPAGLTCQNAIRTAELQGRVRPAG